MIKVKDNLKRYKFSKIGVGEYFIIPNNSEILYRKLPIEVEPVPGESRVGNPGFYNAVYVHSSNATFAMALVFVPIETEVFVVEIDTQNSVINVTISS